MAINRFRRNPAFFESLVNIVEDLDKGHTIDAIDFDQQFQALADYINNILVEELNDLTQGVLNGTDAPGSQNMLFKNVGDGSTEWAFVNGDESLLQDEISLSKLKQAPAGTILTSYQDGEFIANKTPAGNNLILKINTNALNELEPQWGLLTGHNFFDRSLDGSLLADNTLTLDNLRVGTLIVNVADDSIETRHFADSSISTSKLLPGSFEEKHFAPDPELPTAVMEAIRPYNIKKGDLSPLKFLNLSIKFDLSNFKDNVQIPTEKLADESITDDHLIPHIGGFPLTGIGTGVLTPELLAPGFQLQSEHLKLDIINSLSIFKQDVIEAFNSLGIFS